MRSGSLSQKMALLTREDAVASVCPCATNHFRKSSYFIAVPVHFPERCCSEVRKPGAKFLIVNHRLEIHDWMMQGTGIACNCELLANASLCVPMQFFWCGVDVALM